MAVEDAMMSLSFSSKGHVLFTITERCRLSCNSKVLFSDTMGWKQRVDLQMGGLQRTDDKLENLQQL